MSATTKNPEEDIFQKIQMYHYKDEYTPKEFRKFLEMTRHLNRVGREKYTFFVLGCFETLEKSNRNCRERVKAVKKKINEHPDNTKAYLMDDFPDLHAITKFQIITEEIDYIVGVCEHDKGGFLIEQGILVTSYSVLHRTYLLKKEYKNKKEEHENYSWMQSQGVFEVFRYFDALDTWDDKEDLERLTEQLIYQLIP